MIVELGITHDPTRVGFYSGMIKSALSLSAAATMLFWADLSDRYGRRPIILIAVSLCALFSSVFGLARSLPMLVLLRGMLGACNGQAAVSKTMLAEMTNENNQAMVRARSRPSCPLYKSSYRRLP